MRFLALDASQSPLKIKLPYESDTANKAFTSSPTF
jgi:hypothetical protein